MQLEQKLYGIIKETYKEIEEMTPSDGFSSPQSLTRSDEGH